VRCTVLVLLAACGDNLVDKTEMCRLGTEASAATVQDRKVIGGVTAYQPDLSLAARDDELRTSIAARRQAAWQVVAKVLAPVPLAATSYSLPAWHTWFARDDFDRVFKKLYRDLGPDGRKARASLDVDAGFAKADPDQESSRDGAGWRDPTQRKIFLRRNGHDLR